MLMDLHTHTHHSPDAKNAVAEYIVAAQNMGLQILAITDHCEVNHYYPAEYYHETPCEEIFHNGKAIFEHSVAETAALQHDCGDLLLLCGTELGQIPQCPEIAQKLYQHPQMDVAIGSIHELPNLPDFYFLDYHAFDIPQLVQCYFDEVLALARTDCYDVLAHLTYALRYLPARQNYDLSPHLPTIDAIFGTLIQKGKALEFNGSGLKAEQEYTDPDIFLLKRYFVLGGRRLTLATDAHCTAFLGYRMNDMEQTVKDIGFTELTYFRKHKPCFVKL